MTVTKSTSAVTANCNQLLARVVALEAGLTAFKELMAERDKRYEQRAQAQDTAVSAALNSAKEAGAVAKNEVDAHLKALNEIRTMSLDQAKTFAVQKVIDEKFDAIKNEVKSIREAALVKVGTSSGIKEMMGYIIAAITILVVGIGAYFHH